VRVDASALRTFDFLRREIIRRGCGGVNDEVHAEAGFDVHADIGDGADGFPAAQAFQVVGVQNAGVGREIIPPEHFEMFFLGHWFALFLAFTQCECRAGQNVS